MAAPSENLYCRATTRIDVQKRHSDNVAIAHVQDHEVPGTIAHLMWDQAVQEFLITCQAVDLIVLGLVETPPTGQGQTPIWLKHIDPLTPPQFLRFHLPQLSLPVSWRVSLRHISLRKEILQDYDHRHHHKAPANHLSHQLL